MLDCLSIKRRELPWFLAVGVALAMCLPAGGQTFVNKSAELGVSGGNEACWFDMNNDGWVDLCAGGKVYLNRRGVQFVPVADTGAVVAADYDNDGYTDLYSWSGRTVYRNDEGNGFTAVPMPELPAGSSLGATWADLNGDGFVDLYVGGYESWPDATYADFIIHNRGGRGFAVSWSELRFRARGVTSCDYDRDGDMDIYVSNYRLQPNILWQNQGDYSFLDKTAEYNALATDRGFGGGHSIGACWGDFDDDGHIDLFAGNFAHNDGRGHQPESHCLRNRGPGGNFHFEDLGQRGVYYQESYASPAAGDYDNDGDLDLFFTTVYGVASFGVPNNPVLYRNDGSFNFGVVTGEAQLGGLPATYQAAWADYDNDGDLDLMTAGALFENQGGTGNSWLKVRLVGDGSNVNTSAIGGQVRIALPGGRILTRHVEAGTGQGNANDLTLHFGLGTHREPVDLEVFWPDGTTQDIAGVALDQQITLNRQPLVEIVRPVEAVAVESGAGLILDGRVTQPGVSTTWSVESAPEGARVQFGDDQAAGTTVRFSIPGDYEIRLTGEKDGTSSFQSVTITVWPDGPRVRPVGWWKLDEGTGTQVNDSSGNGRHGTRLRFADDSDGWLADGLRYGALSFQPEDGEAVSLDSHAGAISALREGTLAMWVRTTTAEGGLFTIFASGSEEEVALVLQDGVPEFRAQIAGESAPRIMRATVPVNDGLWHHLAVSCNQAGVATLYVDGEHASVGRLPFFSAMIRANRMALARTKAGFYFRGDLDEIRLYPRALPAGEISGLMAQSGALSMAPPIIFPGDSITVPSPGFPLSHFEPFIADGSLERWEQVSGPGPLQFSDPARRTGEVAFPEPGTYLLRIVAQNGSASTYRDLTVVHTGGAVGAPARFRVASLSLPQASTHEIDLDAVFQDPDDADSALSYQVSLAPGGEDLLEAAAVVGGEGAGPAKLVLQPSPHAVGNVLVTISARDPAGNVAVSLFNLSVANTPPEVMPASFALAETASPGQVLGTIPAADLDGDPLRFHLVSGNERGAFAIDPATGELRVGNHEVIDFERTAQFDLRVSVTDPKHVSLDRTVPITIAITDLPETPALQDARFVVRDDATADEVIGSVAGGDPDGDPLSFAITGGDAGGTFAIDAASGQITLADPAGLAGQTHFDLQVSGTDSTGASGEAVIRILPVQALMPGDANVRWLVPPDDSQDATWRDLVHDDRGWTESPLPLGYEAGSGYETLIAGDVDAAMRGQNTTIYARHRFNVSNPLQFGPLILRMRYDDGFLAYLNGTLVAARFSPDDPDWQSGAVASHSDAEAVQFENFDLGRASELLVAGDNIVAVHGLNYLITSSDYLLSAELLAAPRASGVVIMPEGAEVRWSVPADGSEDEDWTEPGFDDSAWSSGPMALGYDLNPDYLPHLATDVLGEMQGTRTSVYLRARFDVPDLSAYSRIWLDMKYDDGFAAFLNGLYVVGANDPPLAELTWESSATASHDDASALNFRAFDLGAPETWLHPGENVLALHGLNYGITSSDFLLSARLLGESAVLLPSGPVGLYPPTVTDAAGSTATVEVAVGALGGASARLFAVWGQRDYGQDPRAWPQQAYLGQAEDPGTYAGIVHGLQAARDYVVRVYARRVESGEVDGWSSAGGFSTAGPPPAPLIAEGGPVQVLIPASRDDAPDWREASFSADRTRWVSGSSAAGFDLAGGFAGPLALDLSGVMQGANASAYLRFPFLIQDPAGVESLTLRMKFDDGFVAYLNGTEIARANAPAILSWNQSATQSRADQEAESFVSFDVSLFRGTLVRGQNVLAIHGLNRSTLDPDFLILPELVAGGDPGVSEPFELWAFENGLYGEDAQPDADSDQNGRSNFEEFAGVELLDFKPDAREAALTLRYRRRAGLRYEVEISEDLTNWQTVSPTASAAVLLAEGEFEVASVQIAASAGVGERAFVRIVATLPADGLLTPGMVLLDTQSTARARVPRGPEPGWTRIDFDDSRWLSGPLGVGYEAGSGYENLIGLDLRTPMQGNNTSAFVRVPFVLADPSTLESLTLRMKYDDGFVAFLNGVQVTSANFDPAFPLTWQSGSLGTHDDSLAVQFEDFDLTGFLAALVPGQNILAIHALNAGLGSSDLLILPELVATGGSQELAAYDLWALSRGLSGTAAGRNADPDGDGTDNFGEFAVAGDPLRFDRERTALRVSPANGGTFLDVTFRRRPGAAEAGVTVGLEISPDLLSWIPAEGIEVDTRPASDGLAELVTVRLPFSGSSGFVRLVAR